MGEEGGGEGTEGVGAWGGGGGGGPKGWGGGIGLGWGGGGGEGGGGGWRWKWRWWWFRRVEGRVVSIQGLAPMMQQTIGQSPWESDSRATAPAPTCPDGKSHKHVWEYGEGQVNRESVSISCNNVSHRGICQKKHSELRQGQTPPRERRLHPDWCGGMLSFLFLCATRVSPASNT